MDNERAPKALPYWKDGGTFKVVRRPVKPKYRGRVGDGRTFPTINNEWLLARDLYEEAPAQVEAEAMHLTLAGNHFDRARDLLHSLLQERLALGHEAPIDFHLTAEVQSFLREVDLAHTEVARLQAESDRKR